MAPKTTNRGSAPASVSTRSRSKRGTLNASSAAPEASASDQQTSKPSRKRKHVEIQQSSSHENVESYLQTFLHTGPSADVKVTKQSRSLKNAGITSTEEVRLNADEQAYLDGLGNTVPTRPTAISHPIQQPALPSLVIYPAASQGGQISDVEVSDDGGTSEDENEDSDGKDVEPDDNLIIQDLTKKSRQFLKSKSKETHTKIVKSDFQSPKLASFVRLCTRKVVCLLNVFPETAAFAWSTVDEEIGRLNAERKGEELDYELKRVKQKPLEMEKLEKYMFYASSSVRFDFGQHVRPRVMQFYGIPEKFTQATQIADAANWLLDKERFHHGEVDLDSRKVSDTPFRSPLLPMILRAYLIESKPKLDQLLVKQLHRTKCIPVHLAIMVSVLIYHATSISEYTSGIKVKNQISGANLGLCYRTVTKTMDRLVKNSPTYANLLQKKLYRDMMTAGPDILSAQTYDYDALEKLAQAELEEEKLEAEPEASKPPEAAPASKKHKTIETGKISDEAPLFEDDDAGSGSA